VALLARELHVELAADLIEALDMAAGCVPFWEAP